MPLALLPPPLRRDVHFCRAVEGAPIRIPCSQLSAKYEEQALLAAERHESLQRDLDEKLAGSLARVEAMLGGRSTSQVPYAR